MEQLTVDGTSSALSLSIYIYVYISPPLAKMVVVDACLFDSSELSCVNYVLDILNFPTRMSK